MDVCDLRGRGVRDKGELVRCLSAIKDERGKILPVTSRLEGSCGSVPPQKLLGLPTIPPRASRVTPVFVRRTPHGADQ